MESIVVSKIVVRLMVVEEERWVEFNGLKIKRLSFSQREQEVAGRKGQGINVLKIIVEQNTIMRVAIF